MLRQQGEGGREGGTYVELVPNLGVGFELAIEGSIPMTSDQTTMFRLDRIIAHNLRVDDAGEIVRTKEV